MKKIFLTLFLIFFLIAASLIAVLSLTGYETVKFNKFISNKVIENNKNIIIKLEKIKFKLEIKNLSLFIETSNPDIKYQNITVPIENVKIYLDFISLIKSKPKIDKVNILSKEINIEQLKKIIVKTKPSNLNSIITNKIVKGKLITNLEIYFDKNLKIKNYIARGKIKEMSAIISKNLILKDTAFNFFADSTDILIKNIESKIDGILFKSGDLQIEKNNNINLKSNFITEVKINNQNIENYLQYLKNNELIINDMNVKANINHNLNITFDKTFKVTNYTYNGKGKITDLTYKLKKPMIIDFLPDKINSISLKNSDFNYRHSADKKNYINTSGSYQINNDNFQNYNFKNKFVDDLFNIETNFDFAQNLNLSLINYNKADNIVAKISSNITKTKDTINFNKIIYIENDNLISIEKLKISKKKFISLKKIKVKTSSKNILKNDFDLYFGENINLKGKKYDATNLNKILNKKSKDNFLKKINKKIDISLENIETPLSKTLTNFKLIGDIENGKFIKIISKGDFGDNKFLDITLKKDKKSKKKYLEIYSDLPRPLLTEYSFFEGLSGGVLIFSSIIDGDSSTNKLIIENFKIVNAPGVVKLLSLADFGGLADLAEGEGLSFEKLEIQTVKNKGSLKLKELFAIGPSISVLMDGYTDVNGLISLRGTLVPAKNLNNFLSKIPFLGKIIIPKEIGEGLFGVSFKMKGYPGKVKTTLNPIKTLTPRFITKAIERTKKTK
ncbi:MAG: hypothetical protein FD550_000060 [Pelagibacterales bacterium]|nr:hypothetical protein [Pelagibacterales bacterium]